MPDFSRYRIGLRIDDDHPRRVANAQRASRGTAEFCWQRAGRSTGNGDAVGMHKITGDITQMAAQVPALFEALSGMKMSDLLAKVKLIGDKSSKADGNGTV